VKWFPELPVRMGVHSGPVSAVTDLNDRTNAAGIGINVAQRVMDCGDSGHILLSKRVAEDLQQYGRQLDQPRRANPRESGCRFAYYHLRT
jgi:class 3 adenylate cyclase